MSRIANISARAKPTGPGTKNWEQKRGQVANLSLDVTGRVEESTAVWLFPAVFADDFVPSVAHGRDEKNTTASASD